MGSWRAAKSKSRLYIAISLLRINCGQTRPALIGNFAFFLREKGSWRWTLICLCCESRENFFHDGIAGMYALLRFIGNAASLQQTDYDCFLSYWVLNIGWSSKKFVKFVIYMPFFLNQGGY